MGPPPQTGPESPPKETRPTLVRVVDAAGAPLAGARVVLFSAPFDRHCALYESELVTARTDDRGRVRVRIGSGRVWSAWAVHDSAKGRLASPVRSSIVAGRPLRLVLERFAVAKVRIRGLAQWRERFGDDLGCAFGIHLAPHAVIRSELPAGEEPVLALPPLPMGNYFPLLTTAEGEFLDARYFSPEFLEDNPPEELYERRVPLKRFVLGVPTVTRWQVRDPTGDPVAGARVFVRPFYAGLQHERRLTADARGEFELVLPYRAEGQRGWTTIRVFLLAPGRRTFVRVLDSPVSGKDGKLQVRLARGPELHWKLVSEEGHDFTHEKIWLRTFFASELRKSGASALVPIQVGADGRLELPAPGNLDHEPWQLFGLRDGLPVQLWSKTTGVVPRELELDLRRLVPVALDFVHRGEKGVLGGEAHLCRLQGGRAVDSTPYPIDRDGTCRLQLMPGEHRFYAMNDRRGDAFFKLVVAPGKPVEKTIHLRPFTRIAGVVRSPGGDPAEGVDISTSPSIASLDAQLFQSWHSRLFGRIRSDEHGRFELRVSRLVTILDVSAQRQNGDEWWWANLKVDPRSQPKLEIQLQR